LSSVILGLGSNLDDPPSRLAAALHSIAGIATIDCVSAVYRTEPVGGIEQPDFYNLVCRVFTGLSPFPLLEGLLEIERSLGRVRSERYGPRSIDIDLLCHGDLVLETPDLVVPHPRMHERPFVLVPLIEVAPRWRHPVLGATASELLAACAPARIEEIGRLQQFPGKGKSVPDGRRDGDAECCRAS
jgi:2-amino-4-hydroxy-6-hydroxymethyldihydropteridine diphosphokinase